MLEQLSHRGLKLLSGILAACVCTAAVPSAQHPTNIPVGTATISGFVFEDTTDRPVEGAQVALHGATRSFSASTRVDRRGHFEFTQVPDGGYSVVAHLRGYDGTCYGLVGK